MKFILIVSAALSFYGTQNQRSFVRVFDTKQEAESFLNFPVGMEGFGVEGYDIETARVYQAVPLSVEIKKKTVVSESQVIDKILVGGKKP